MKNSISSNGNLIILIPKINLLLKYQKYPVTISSQIIKKVAGIIIALKNKK